MPDTPRPAHAEGSRRCSQCGAYWDICQRYGCSAAPTSAADADERAALVELAWRIMLSGYLEIASGGEYEPGCSYGRYGVPRHVLDEVVGLLATLTPKGERAPEWARKRLEAGPERCKNCERLASLEGAPTREEP